MNTFFILPKQNYSTGWIKLSRNRPFGSFIF